MDRLVHVPTKADTHLWLQRLWDEADQEDEPGILHALRKSLPTKYRMEVVGSVACDGESLCIQGGVCEVANSGYSRLSSLLARVAANEESAAEQRMQERFDELLASVTRSRLRLAELQGYAETQVVTTIIPMCSVCWATDNLHLDHIIPKSKGGLNSHSNYQLLCAYCNSSKNDRDMSVWHRWVNESEDEGAIRIRTRRAENRRMVLEGEGEK